MSAQSDFSGMIQEFFNDDPLVATYHQYSQGSYDPSTSAYTTIQVDTLVQAILLDLTRNLNGSSSKFGTSISEGDKELYMKPILWGETPFRDTLDNITGPDTTSDKVTVGGWTYKVGTMRLLDPKGNSPMLYNLHLRR